MNSEEIRTRLLSDLDRLTRRDAALEKHLRQADGRLDADFSDQVAFTEMDEVLEALDDAGRAEIAALQQALARLDSGEYGVCVKCGEDIDERRLMAVPSTPFCVTCAP